MDKEKYLYMTCPKCGGKIKIMAPGRRCVMVFDCPHCHNKLKLVYVGKEQ